MGDIEEFTPAEYSQADATGASLSADGRQRAAGVTISHSFDAYKYRLPQILGFTKSAVTNPFVLEYIEPIGRPSESAYTLSGDEAVNVLNLTAGDKTPHVLSR